MRKRRLLVAALEAQQNDGGSGTACHTVRALLAGLQPSNFRATQLHLRLLLDEQVGTIICIMLRCACTDTFHMRQRQQLQAVVNVNVHRFICAFPRSNAS